MACSQYHQGALRVLRPHYLDGVGKLGEHPTYTIINPGGAYLGADQYLLGIEIQENASLTLTTQSATKVYKTPQGPAQQDMKILAASGAYLEYVPDPLIIYRQGEYHQRTELTMHTGASLVLAEIITPGWEPGGSPFSYRGMKMRTLITVADGTRRALLALDNLRIYPQESPISGAGNMEGFSHTGQLLIASQKVTEELLHRIQKTVDESYTRSGISVLGTEKTLGVRGIVVRSLAHTTAHISQLHTDIINAFRQEIAGLPPMVRT